MAKQKTARDYLPGRGAWEMPKEMCPYCGAECEAEFTNVDVGMVQISPYQCERCGAIEIGSYDCRCNMTEDDQSHAPDCRVGMAHPGELRAGWYKPTIPPEPDLPGIEQFLP